MAILADNDLDGSVKNVVVYQYSFLTKFLEKKREEKSETVNMPERKRETCLEHFHLILEVTVALSSLLC